MNRIITALAFGLLLCCGTLHATATLESFKFSTPDQEQHFKDLIEELRCLVCQNQSLADSDAELAHDLRVEVYEHMQQGKSDEEVIDFLVSRYGDFVLYNPPVKPSTYLLWYGPFVLLALGLVLLVKNIRQRDRQRRTEAELSQEEQARLDALLGERDEQEPRS
jgi:cytochrome c-type biogenesis protein CcmH